MGEGPTRKEAILKRLEMERALQDARSAKKRSEEKVAHFRTHIEHLRNQMDEARKAVLISTIVAAIVGLAIGMVIGAIAWS